MKGFFLLACLFPSLVFCGDASKGRELALARMDGGCLLCHAIPGADRPAGDIGPSLAGVGARLAAEDMRARIVDASRLNPETIMPPYGRVTGLHSVAPQYRDRPILSREQIDDLVAFLVTLKDQSIPSARPPVPVSGELRRLQASDAENPGMLWADRGARIWQERCASCHRDPVSMKGVAARYPRVVEGRVIGLEEKIREKVAFGYESDDLLGITTFVAMQSRGVPMAGQATDEDVARGKTEYYRRRGQMNLSCAHCHERNPGKHLGAETLSEGQSNGYPTYRLEWQKLGSLQRRLRACLFGVHAELPPFGSPLLLDLELFLARRADGRPIEAPAVRR